MKWILAFVAISVLLFGCAQHASVNASQLEGRWVANYDPEMQQMLDDSHGKVGLELEILPDSRFKLISVAGDSEMINFGTVELLQDRLLLRDGDNPKREILVEVQDGGERLYLPSIRTGFVRAKP
jgi:hypothetical protein